MHRAEQILEKYWGYKTYRPLQLEIIQSVLDKQDTLALLPTGGGKSICFQVPGLILEGVCIVVSPLIALMKDQVYQLNSRNIAAGAVYSGMTYSEIDQTLDAAVAGKLKFLYISPERLKTDIFIERAKRMKISLLAVDEAHCISKWGYDFRPAYLVIKEFKKYIENTNVIALTATATKEVKNDIVSQLDLKKVNVFTQSFARKNLSYSATFSDFKEEKLLNILGRIPGTSIVYVKTRKKAVEVSKFLISKNVSADFYHAGINLNERNIKQEDWINNKTRVIVSTNAFGMGIDKAEVRSVIHLDLCENMEAYYQESGRAGRDGKKAYAVNIFNTSDLENQEANIDLKYPEITFVKKVYQSICNYYQLAVGAEVFESFDFDIQEFGSTFGLNPRLCHYALKLLENQGILYLNDAYFNPSKLKIICNTKELYSFQLRNPKYDGFLKTVLRVYGGEIYANYITISESEISSASFTSKTEVTVILEFLNNQKLVHFIPQKNKAQLGLLTARQDAEKLSLNYAEIAKRKAADLKALKSIKYYILQKHKCRMNVIQDYFDEQTETRCGICDNCVRLSKKGIAIEVYDAYEKTIKQLLPCSLNDLNTNSLLPNKTIITEIIKLKLEEEDYGLDDFGLLYLK